MQAAALVDFALFLQSILLKKEISFLVALSKVLISEIFKLLPLSHNSFKVNGPFGTKKITINKPVPKETNLKNVKNMHLEEVLDEIKESKRPLLLIGAGAKNKSYEDLNFFIEKLDLPYLKTWMSFDIYLEKNNSNYFGNLD